MNFQGRLLTATGAVVPDGNYNMEFGLISGGTGCVSSGSPPLCGGTSLWTEDWLNHNGTGQGVVVKNGYFSVQLGSITTLPTSVSLDVSPLWLNMTVASGGATSTICTTFALCNSSNEPAMTPFRELSAAPYALNADNANQLGGLSSTGYIQNVTSPQTSANIDIISGNSSDPGAKIQQASSATAPVLILEGGNTPGAGGDILQLQNTSGSSGILDRVDSSGNLYMATGLGIDSQTGSGTLTIGGTSGTTNATTINIGNTGSAANQTIDIALESNTSGSETVNIATTSSSSGSDLVVVGSTNGTSATTINGGSGNINLDTNQAGSGTIVKTSTNSITAFQVQSTSAAVLTADTVNSKVSVQGINSAAVLGSELVSSPTCTGTNWSGTGPWAHATGSTTSLSCTPPASVTSGAVYQVTFDTQGSPTTGESVKPNVGGVNGQPVYGNVTTQVQLVTTTGTGNLKFTPTTNWNGSIANISLKLVTLANSVLVVQNSDATTGLEVRSGGSALFNTFIGQSAGQSDITGGSSVAVGYQALQNNTTGTNSALGYQALSQNTTGSSNTAVGWSALLDNTTASQNTAIGDSALKVNTTGTTNTAVGQNALSANTTGTQNTAVGQGALQVNTTGTTNTAVGQAALGQSTGNNDVAVGKQAGNANTTGNKNTYIGVQAGYQDPNNTVWNTGAAIQNATAIGYGSQVQASNALILGGQGSNQASIGIGTTNPTNLLSVSPDAYDTGTAGTGGVASATVTGVSTVWTSAMVGDEFVFADGTKQTVTAVASNTSLTLANAVTEAAGQSYRLQLPALQVTSAGNVGIGTAIPTANLQVTTQTNTTTAFEVQNAAGINLLTANTTNMQVSTENLNVGQGANVSTASRVFSDGFESDDDHAWIAAGGGSSGRQSTTSSQSNISWETSTVHSGKYAEQITNTSSTNSAEETVIPSQATVYARVYFNLGATGVGATTYLMDVGNNVLGSGTAHIMLEYQQSNAFLCYQYNGGAAVCSTTTPSPNAWHKLEMEVTNTGGLTYWLDNVQAYTVSGAAWNGMSPNWDNFALGSLTSPTATTTTYFDDAAVDSQSTGDSGSAYVQDSLHVSGYSSFGNGLFVSGANSSYGLYANTNGNGIAVQGSSNGGTSGLFQSNNSTNTQPTLVTKQQATSTADLFQAQNNSGTPVFKIGSTGNTTIQPSTNTTSAFQIQNAAGEQSLNVNNTNPITDLTNNQSDNEITNSSFEGANLTTGWTALSSTLSQTTNVSYYGNDALQVFTAATANAGAEYALTSGTTLVTNTAYTFTAYVRSFNNGGNWTTMQMGYNSGGTNNNCLSAQNVTWNGWEKFQCTFTTGATLTTPYIYIEQSDATARIFYVDGVQLQRWSLLSNASAEQAFTASDWQAFGGATVTQSTAFAVDGTHSVQVATNSSSTLEGLSHNITLTPNTQYSMWFDMYVATTSLGSDLEVGYYNGSTYTPCMSGQPATANQWSYYYCSFTTPSSNSGTPYFYIDDNTVKGTYTFYVDAVQFNEGNYLAGYENGQISINGTVDSPLSIQNAYDSTQEFSVNNAEGNSMFSVDSTDDTDTFLQNAQIYYQNTSGTAGFTIGNALNNPTDALRFRTNPFGANFESGGVDLYVSGWSNGAMTGNQFDFFRGEIGNGNVWVGNGVGTGGWGGGPTLLELDQYNNASDPTLANFSGSMYWNSNKNQFRCYEGEYVDCLGGIAGVASAASTALNTCTACTAFSTSGTAIPANYCQAGKVIHIYAAGVFGTNSTAPSLNLSFYLGTSTTKTSDTLIGSGSPTVTPAISLSGEPWTVDYTITCYSTTSWNGQGTWQYQNSTTATTQNVDLQFANTSTTEVTTAENIYLFPTFGTSNAANTITLDQWIVSVN